MSASNYSIIVFCMEAGRLVQLEGKELQWQPSSHQKAELMLTKIQVKLLDSMGGKKSCKNLHQVTVASQIGTVIHEWG